MAAAADRDRFGLGWRHELAAGIAARLEGIDVLEVIAEDWFDAPRARIDALRWLARSVPVSLHGVSLGLASSEAVDERRLSRLARLFERIACERWSEHLAFVRGGGIEIGHLAAPPRNSATLDGAARNLERAAKVVGIAPLVENVATLIDPPLSTLSEPEWIAGCQQASGCELLLDLHNLHANATNFDFDAIAFLDAIPCERVSQIHIAGGRWIQRGSARRLLDDHLHDVPDPVFALLEEVGARVPRPITVILERDGRFAGVDALLAELSRARVALAKGRTRAGFVAEVLS